MVHILANMMDNKQVRLGHMPAIDACIELLVALLDEALCPDMLCPSVEYSVTDCVLHVLTVG